MPARRGVCPKCGRRIALTTHGRLWAHGRPLCAGAGTAPARPQRTGYIPELSLGRRFWHGRRIRTVHVAGGLL
ncbi:hypothetical protein GCM10010405_46490 [Streptomyces macrosporus]|uniref:Uncharacterized protein n=1 Tax=Streptomyces macrosporus TaxID=44032 RepID=A0ABN3KE28_9ACTN